MAADRALLAERDAPPTLRLYRWNPWTLSLGYFQKESEFDLDALRAQGYGVVRRPTGGSAVFHAEELTFAIAVDEENPWIPRRVQDSYRVIHEAVQAGLRKLGVATRFRGGAGLPTDARGNGMCFYDSSCMDLVVDAAAGPRKIVGSAQRRSRGRILHHGSIVLRPNPVTPESGSVEMAAGAVDFAQAQRAIAAGFEESFKIRLRTEVLVER